VKRRAQPGTFRRAVQVEVPPPASRDAFLSHRSVDKDVVRRLAADIRSAAGQGRHLTAWLDEAEIRPGQSIPAEVNRGLENSKFFALIMTPAYFDPNSSGWTDAEWHAALHSDPDNRRGRIIPVLAADCPYIPMLLRHLLAIDIRGNNYNRGLDQLLAILRGDQQPRPVAYRGQLIRSSGRVDRATLVAERAVPDGDPDAVVERLSCNLLPIERPPAYLYSAPLRADLVTRRPDGTTRLPTKAELRERIRQAQLTAGADRPWTPAFRLVSDRVYSFHEMGSDESALSAIVDTDRADDPPADLRDCLQTEEQRKLVVSLLNMSLSRHLRRCGLLADETKASNRFFFPPKDGQQNQIHWRPFKKMVMRTVAKPYMEDGRVACWLHQAAYIKVVFLGQRFFIQITPTWLLTDDGARVKGGPEVGRVVIQWTGRERNLSVLYHVRFWTSVMRDGRQGPISIWVGDQSAEVATVPAFVELQHGIRHDQKDLLQTLDELAPAIASMEDEAEVRTRSVSEETVDAPSTEPEIAAEEESDDS